jgi:hypothetical protein
MHACMHTRKMKTLILLLRDTTNANARTFLRSGERERERESPARERFSVRIASTATATATPSRHCCVSSYACSPHAAFGVN